MMGKKLLLLAAAMLFLPTVVRADSATAFFYYGGTLAGTNGALSLSDSSIGVVTGSDGLRIVGSDLGTVSFSTGILQSGTIEGGVFLSGGNFTILGGGTDGIPAGVLFTGTFFGRNGWSTYTRPDGSHHHVLHGGLDGTWLGSPVTNVPMELTVDNDGVSFSSSGQVIRGSILLPGALPVPEPGSATFLGMGIVVLGAAFFSKLVFKPNQQ